MAVPGVRFLSPQVIDFLGISPGISPGEGLKPIETIVDGVRVLSVTRGPEDPDWREILPMPVLPEVEEPEEKFEWSVLLGILGVCLSAIGGLFCLTGIGWVVGLPILVLGLLCCYIGGRCRRRHYAPLLPPPIPPEPAPAEGREGFGRGPVVQGPPHDAEGH